ncbi:acyl-CoA dehydrogenase family protein [Kribbella sp.]|uniref:acyl-CoA dehydrogenase family protein n=1 Tax=Kribbella sp. TaxID=1871183 RepID=UPI002D3A974D|nr:acyl-CoA dehydrogenase family protein [Kribbella sp.]HZX08215.1 acyl-CoA dehydrogenase family protein [Kribbella sp.]
MTTEEAAGQRPYSPTGAEASATQEEIYTIFEGTSEIQRLVIARAISGMRIR